MDGISIELIQIPFILGMWPSIEVYLSFHVQYYHVLCFTILFTSMP